VKSKKMAAFAIIIFFISVHYLRPDFGFATVYGHFVDESTGLWIEAKGEVNYGAGTTDIIYVGDGWFYVTAVPGTWDFTFETIGGLITGGYPTRILGVQTVKDEIKYIGKIKISSKPNAENRIISPRTLENTTRKPIIIDKSLLKKKRGSVKFIKSDNNKLKLKTQTTFPVRWNTKNLVSKITRFLRVNIVLFDRNGNKKIGRIASDIHLSKRMFRWKVGKVNGNRSIPEGDYILKLVMKPGQVMAEIPILIRK